MNKIDFFQIPNQTLHRDDVLSAVLQLNSKISAEDLVKICNNLTDEEMTEIAGQMGKYMVDQSWWGTLQEVAFDFVKDKFEDE